MVRLAIFLIVIATLIGALMPAGFGGPYNGRVETIGVDTADTRQDPAQLSDSGSGTITLSRSFDGHFYADAQVNGTTIHFLVDTGASVIALSGADAQRAGLALSGDPQIIGAGASGQVWGHVVRLNRVELGVKSISDTPAVVLAGGDRSLLGQSFLSQFGSVEINGNTMVLR